VQRSDRSLDHVRAGAAQRQRAIEARAPFGDLRRVPQRAILLGQQNQLAVVRARRAARVVQQHHRQQPMHLRLVRHQLGERLREPDRLGDERAAAVSCRVTLVEDQVDHCEHRRQAVGQQVIGRHAKRNARELDLALRAHQPLRHRRLADEERARDLARVEAAERAQRQRDLRVDRQRRVTTREDELEALVREAHLILTLLGHVHRLAALLLFELLRLARERAIAADPVDRAVARRAQQPPARVRRRTVAWPALRRDRERLLSGLLGEVEVAEKADQRREHAWPLLAKDVFERFGHPTIGRISIAPPMLAAGICDASSIAASRSSASKNR
jgi:hypothetical protein